MSYCFIFELSRAGGGWRAGPSRLLSSWCVTFVSSCHSGRLLPARGGAAITHRNCTAVKQTAGKHKISGLLLLLIEGEGETCCCCRAARLRWRSPWSTHPRVCCFTVQVGEPTCRLCVHRRCLMAVGSEPVRKAKHLNHSNLSHKKYKLSDFSSLCCTK